MMKLVAKIFIVLVFTLGMLPISAQSKKWDEITKNIKNKSGGAAAVKYIDNVLPQLKESISKKSAILTSQSAKIANLNLVAAQANAKILSNNRLILSYKGLISAEQKGAANAGKISSHMGEIEKLIRNNKSQKKILKQRKTFKTALQKSKKKLEEEVLGLKSSFKHLKKTANILNYDEALGAGFSVLGEFAAWTEGNSSFKNVLLRAAKDGGKAAVSIGGGALSSSAAAVMSLNPFAAGGAAVLGSLTAEEFFLATIGKTLDRLMDKEHYAINKYAVDPIELAERRHKDKMKLYKEIKKISKEIIIEQDDYNEQLRDFIEGRKKLWDAFEEKMKQDAEEQRKLEAEETPYIVQRPSKKKIKPGESITISVETTGGLLPITYSGELSYVVDNNSDRYLIAYKWTARKNEKPGIYEFIVRAKSASGIVGSSTINIEVIDTNPAPKKVVRDDSNDKTYDAKDLNIKEIPGGDIREMIYKVNGIYDGICEATSSNIKTQKFDIQIGVNTGNIEGKLGLVLVKNFAGRTTVPMTDEQKEAVLVKLREKGLLPHMPYPDYLDDFYTYYFHLWGRNCKFDPVSGRIWGEVNGEYSIYHNYAAKADFKGSIEASLNNGIITGIIKFPTKNKNYSFPFTARQ